ncbi:MAG: hypothetical protein KF782_26685 [Labilithrix sp.]|nr:hypothetical protein [Labilithrix sp.]
MSSADLRRWPRSSTVAADAVAMVELEPAGSSVGRARRPEDPRAGAATTSPAIHRPTPPRFFRSPSCSRSEAALVVRLAP